MEDSSKRGHDITKRSQIEAGAKKRLVRPTIYDRETLKPKYASSGSVSLSTQSSCSGIMRPVDLATLYIQQLHSDANTRHERSSSAGLLNLSVGPASLQQDDKTLQAFSQHEFEVPRGRTDGLQHSEQLNSSGHLARILRCNSDGHACQSSHLAADRQKQLDAGVPTTERLLCFKQETKQVSVPISKCVSDGETQFAEVRLQAISTPAHLTMSSMPDVVASAIQKVSSSSANSTQSEPSVACTVHPNELLSTDEAGKVLSNAASYAIKSSKSTYTAPLALLRANSSECRTTIARTDAIELLRDPIRILESADQRGLVVGERKPRVEECAPRAAKLKKFGSGEQLAVPTHTERYVPITKQSGSACESIKPSDSARRQDEAHATFATRISTSIGTSNWSSSVTGSSLNSSQSTLDSLESSSFSTRSFRLSPFLTARLTPTACTDAMQQLTAEMTESAMMNYDEEIADHLVNAASNSRVAVHRNGIDNISGMRFSASAQHVNGCNHSNDSIAGSPASAGRRSAYFPSTVCDRCTNPVSNVLEFGDERHFIPLRNPTRDEI